MQPNPKRSKTDQVQGQGVLNVSNDQISSSATSLQPQMEEQGVAPMTDQQTIAPEITTTLGDRLQDNLLANWVKCVIALEITNDVGRQFVQQEIEKFHWEITKGIDPRTVCTNCKIDSEDKCPNSICDAIKKEIIKNHRREPAFTNTHMPSWLTDPWEIAKCYMPEKKKKCLPSDVDFSVTINVIINNLKLSQIVSLNRKDGIKACYKSKAFRNTIFHPGTLGVNKNYMEFNLKILSGLLTDFDMPGTANAKAQINELMDNELTLTTEPEAKVHRAVLKVISRAATGKQLQTPKEVNESVRNLLNRLCKVPERRLLSNFIQRSVHALDSLLKTHIQNNKPPRNRDNNWTLESFLDKIEYNPKMKYLSKAQKDILYPVTGQQVDKGEWDPFLFCLVLEMESQTPIPSSVASFIGELRKTRDKLLDEPKKFKVESFEKLYDCLNDSLKKEMKDIFERNDLLDHEDITLHPLLVLRTWQDNDEKMDNSQITRNELEKMMEENQKDVKIKLEAHDRLIDLILQKLGNVPSVIGKDRKVVGGIYDSSNTSVIINPVHTSAQNRENLQNAITSNETNATILEGSGAVEHFEDQTETTFQEFDTGCIVLKAKCQSTKHLFNFWNGCMDGSVAEAMSKIRDEYRKYLRCETLEFEIVLTKKEVRRCLEEIVLKYTSRIEELERLWHGVVEPIAVLNEWKEFVGVSEEELKRSKALDQEVESIGQTHINVPSVIGEVPRANGGMNDSRK